MTTGPKPRPLRERMLRFIVIDETTGCWLWQGACDSKGYGNSIIGSKTDGTRRNVRMHRFTYELVHGPLASSTHLHHECRERTVKSHTADRCLPCAARARARDGAGRFG